MSGALIGRDREVALISTALARATGRVAAVMLEGAAGIGKTAVLGHVAAAHTDGRTVVARPTDNEAALTFAVLADLLEQLPESALDGLPAAQQTALDAALLRTGDGAAPNPRAIGNALRTVLSRVAAEQPLLLVVDDVQWADRASCTALGFALRRLDAAPVAVLTAARVDRSPAPDPLGLVRGLASPPVRVALGPLTLSALFQVIREHTGLVFPRPALARIAGVSGGNPLYAVELARALGEHGAVPPADEPLPVPDTLDALIAARLAGVPVAYRQALLAIALGDGRGPAELEQMLGRDAHVDAVLATGMVELHAGQLRFSHPLFAAGMIARASVDERRTTHRRLAAIAHDPERRARHLALGADGPDEHTAAELAGAAERAARRGAPETAAELMQLACRVAPSSIDAASLHRRRRLAEMVHRAGDAPAARELLECLIDDSPPGPSRATALELFARLMCFSIGAAEAARRCDAALAQAGDDPHLLARLYATRTCVEYDDTDVGLAYGERALALLDSVPDPDPIVFTQAVMGYMGHLAYRGDPFPTELIERALAYEQRHPGPDVCDRLGPAYGAQLKYSGRLAEARRYLLAGYQAALDEGDEGSLPAMMSHLPQLELWAGNWAEAERWAIECLTLAERTGQTPHQISALGALVQVHGYQGRFAEALAAAERGFALIEASGDHWQAGPLHGSLGFVYLATGEIGMALEHLERAERISTTSDVTRPRRTTRAYAEALFRSGDLAAAERVAVELERNARRTEHHDQLGGALTCRALVAAAEQRFDEALELSDAAVAALARGEEPFARAAGLLARGQILRRRGERRAAVAALDAAEQVFVELGAPTFAELAAAERARIPTRRKTGPGLTEGEQRVAELAARGLGNRAIAAELFLSANTVEATLTRVYAKLGVRSRAELAARAAQSPGDSKMPAG